uniref:Coiled-coil domain containing 152 n=1 Tax=Podarcis muralis TaxID=64176 RepID=A0A670JLG6_PODMU|nr:coiled-coil domain-containing protein 152 [Podarcis muralis]XP_028604412.1 coiled-coil domain-containing protein 152 [Podarcis muralis]XP_028604413.1 coiled-coil domain-containing protein 152 [Podarcis muralis]XP_028604414.1 coiled-coil domain-containing protein 152 [Podarcis muralis]XP_028604415.1 coiled-coil domain-containing protein 152 [Podarcis muralis]
MKKISVVNLDALLEGFLNIEKKISGLHGKNNILSLQLDETNKLLTASQMKEESAREECATLQNVIKGLQQTIENQYNLRDESERLKNTAHNLEEKLKSQEQEHKNMVDRLMREIEKKEEEHKLEQWKLQYDMNKKFEAMEEEHKLLIEKKDMEILELTKQLRAQEKEKQDEIIKLQIEFNAELVKLQTKMPKSYPNPTSLPQNIYRRKLQHLQEEKNKEIEVLRNTIRNLEQRLGKGEGVHFKC